MNSLSSLEQEPLDAATQAPLDTATQAPLDAATQVPLDAATLEPLVLLARAVCARGTTALASHIQDHERISPNLLDTEWTESSRILSCIFLFAFGFNSGVFYLSSFFVDKSLRKGRFVYLACLGLADMVMTCGVAPIIGLVLLSGQGDTLTTCHIIQYMGHFSTYSYSLFFMLVGVETFICECCSKRAHAAFLTIHVALVALVVFVISAMLSYADVYMGYDYDYCTRQFCGDDTYKTTVTSLVYVVPFVVTLGSLTAAMFTIQKRARRSGQYRRSEKYSEDITLVAANITVYIVYALFWLPHFIITHLYPDSSDKTYYYTAWLGAFRAVLPLMLYITIDNSFRRAFAYIFNYGCCKSGLSPTAAYRPRRAAALAAQEAACRAAPPSDRISVHILRSAINAAASSQRICAGPLRSGQCL